MSMASFSSLTSKCNGPSINNQRVRVQSHAILESIDRINESDAQHIRFSQYSHTGWLWCTDQPYLNNGKLDAAKDAVYEV